MLKQTHTQKMANTITTEEIRELHIALLKAVLLSEKLQEKTEPDSLVSTELSAISTEIDALIFNNIYDINDLLFDKAVPYEPITEEEIK